MPNYFEFDQNKQQDYNAGGVNESGYQLSPELYQALYGKGGYGVNKAGGSRYNYRYTPAQGTPGQPGYVPASGGYYNRINGTQLSQEEAKRLGVNTDNAFKAAHNAYVGTRPVPTNRLGGSINYWSLFN